jgi:hypothetical protein
MAKSTPIIVKTAKNPEVTNPVSGEDATEGTNVEVKDPTTIEDTQSVDDGDPKFDTDNEKPGENEDLDKKLDGSDEDNGPDDDQQVDDKTTGAVATGDLDSDDEVAAEVPGEDEKIYTLTNDEGYRNLMIRHDGEVPTEIDDDTAAIFYENPKFYTYVFDADRQDRVIVSQMRWCLPNGTASSEVVGEKYTLGEDAK